MRYRLLIISALLVFFIIGGCLTSSTNFKNTTKSIYEKNIVDNEEVNVVSGEVRIEGDSLAIYWIPAAEEKESSEEHRHSYIVSPLKIGGDTTIWLYMNGKKIHETTIHVEPAQLEKYKSDYYLNEDNTPTEEEGYKYEIPLYEIKNQIEHPFPRERVDVYIKMKTEKGTGYGCAYKMITMKNLSRSDINKFYREEYERIRNTEIKPYMEYYNNIETVSIDGRNFSISTQVYISESRNSFSNTFTSPEEIKRAANINIDVVTNKTADEELGNMTFYLNGEKIQTYHIYNVPIRSNHTIIRYEGRNDFRKEITVLSLEGKKIDKLDELNITLEYNGDTYTKIVDIDPLGKAPEPILQYISTFEKKN